MAYLELEICMYFLASLALAVCVAYLWCMLEQQIVGLPKEKFIYLKTSKDKDTSFPLFITLHLFSKGWLVLGIQRYNIEKPYVSYYGISIGLLLNKYDLDIFYSFNGDSYY